MDYKLRVLNGHVNIQSSFERIIIYYVLSGEVRIKQGKEIKMYAQDAFFFVKPFSPPIILNSDGEVLELMIDKRSFNRYSLLNSEKIYQKEHHIQDVDAAIKDEILHVMDAQSEPTLFNSDLHMIRLINYIDLAGYIDNVANVNNELVINVLHYVNAHYKSELSVNKIAEHFYVNTSYLSRVFSETLNISLLNYIRKIKMYSIAIDIISLKTDQNIWQDYGFKTYESYLKNFKKTFDLTPSEFLKNPPF